GIDRNKAARFSFLMVLPLIIGKSLLDVKSIFDGELNVEIGITPLIVGFAAAFFAGIFACHWMIQLVKRAKLKYFAYYCFVVGIIAAIYSLNVL
ncbi:MAG: undecaprenyl-diphosphate phosphatase, partial [Salibacteraceae bacterium]